MGEGFYWRMWTAEVGDRYYNISNSAAGSRRGTIRKTESGGPSSGGLFFALEFDDGRVAHSTYWCSVFGWTDDSINLIRESWWEEDQDKYEKAMRDNRGRLAEQKVRHEKNLKEDLLNAQEAHDEYFDKD